MRNHRKHCILFIVWLEWFLIEANSATIPDFHTILSQDEMKRYFDTESVQDTAFDYDVVPISHQRTARNAGPHDKNYRLEAFNKEFNLVLKPNDDVISNAGLVIERRQADGLLTRATHEPQGRFYVGHVASDPGSHVAIRETEKEGHLSGAFLSEGHMYKIEPLSHDLHQRAQLDGSSHHVISRRSINSLTSTSQKTDPIEVSETGSRSNDSLQMEEDIENDDSQSKRSGVYRGKIYIEAMLTADKTTCDFFGNDTVDYLLNVANLISRLYKDTSIGMNVSWTLVKIFLVQGVDPDLDFTLNNITSASKYLWKFRTWAANRNTPDGTAEHYDHSALLTRSICGLNSCYMNGLAYFYRPCNKYWGASVNSARGLSVAYTVAHEMAHNLGVAHDSSKDCRKGYIMQGTQASGVNAFHWSPCSRARLRRIFSERTCLHNKPPKELATPTVLPGYAVGIHKQCQIVFGEEYRACFAGKTCGALYCTNGGNCHSLGGPVAEGTECGYRKWCRAGLCTDVGSSLPPAIDGGWGSWTGYGPCTRTCGGGVMFRSRQCNNPAPQYFGKPCSGPDKAFFKFCNGQECKSGNFRDEQCKALDANYYYHRVGSNNCALTCVDKTVGRGSFYGPVKDGTRCETDPYILDVCVLGKCQTVGCDRLLGSEKVYDRCLVCGGDGSSCVLRIGNYTKNYRVYGPYAGDTMITIPKGATNVEIVERSPSFNFLSIRSHKTLKYYVPVPSWTRTFKAAGTAIFHYMKKYVDAEKIFIKGPTSESLDAMYVYSGRHGNPGITYQFYIPGNAPATTFSWRSKEGSCSATCGGGTKKFKVTCHRADDESQVTPTNNCDSRTKPAVHAQCNTNPCPPQFKVGVWSPCTELCGGGQRHRNVTCVQVVSPDRTVVLDPSRCSHLKAPPTTENCNGVDCRPEWVVGEWSQCSVPCGDNATRSRTVECKKKLANQTWVVLADNECKDFIIGNPQKMENCDAMAPCHAWKVEYPCVSCGGNDRTYVPVGCFHDSHQGGRPLPTMLANLRNQINWHKMKETVDACAQDAWAFGFPVFGVQFYGECWSGLHGYVTYDKDGFNIRGCWEGVGKTRNNYVYAFTSIVVEPIVQCIYTPNNQTVSDDKCNDAAQRPHAKMKLCKHACPS